MKILYIVLLVLVGCHGSELRLGTIHNFTNDSGYGVSNAGGYGSSVYSYEHGDEKALWLELAFQLSPKSIVLDNSKEIADMLPVANVPLVNNVIPIPTIPKPNIYTDLEPQIVLIENRLDQLEKNAEGMISWNSLLVNGGGGTGGLATIAYLTVLYRRRKSNGIVQEPS